MTSILLYTVAPIALPYLIFSKVREREETSNFYLPAALFRGGFLHLSFLSLDRSSVAYTHRTSLSPRPSPLTVRGTKDGETDGNIRRRRMDRYMTEPVGREKELTLSKSTCSSRQRKKGL